MRDLDSMQRTCGACGHDTAVAALSFERKELIWVCPECAFIELSDTYPEAALRQPNRDELRQLLERPMMGRSIKALQRKIRLGQLKRSEAVQWPEPNALAPAPTAPLREKSRWDKWEPILFSLAVASLGLFLGAITQ